MTRLYLYIGILLLTPFMPWWLFGILALGYCYRFDGYELIALGVCIDAYYGSGIALPLYTVVSIVALFFALHARPFLSV